MGEQTSLAIISLSTLLNSKEVDKDTIQCALSSFCPVKDHEDIKHFLDRAAIPQEEQKISRTYLWLDEESLAIEKIKILGFFAIALKVFKFSADIPTKKRQRITKNSNEETNQYAPAFLIGQVSRSIETQKGIGSSLVYEALRRIKEVQNIIGGNFIYLDCHNETKIIDNYMKSGFKYLQDKQDGSGDIQMYLKL